jgi:hypothetical protein
LPDLNELGALARILSRTGEASKALRVAHGRIASASKRKKEMISINQADVIARKIKSTSTAVLGAYITLVGFGRASSVRLPVEGDKPGEQPAGVATLMTDGGSPRILFTSKRHGTTFVEPLPGFTAQDRGAADDSSAARSSDLARVAEEIACESTKVRRGGIGRDYFEAKHMLGWEGVRYAGRTHSFMSSSGKPSKILQGTPVWLGQNCETGKIQCAQGKFWSRDGRWQIVTCGPVTGAWVVFKPTVEKPWPDTVPFFLCEGVSTGWAIQRMLGGRAFVIASMGKDNLTRCAVAARKRVGTARQLLVVADVDGSGGEQKAEAAARAAQALALAPITAELLAQEHVKELLKKGVKLDAWDLWRHVGTLTSVAEFLPLSALPTKQLNAWDACLLGLQNEEAHHV